MGFGLFTWSTYFVRTYNHSHDKSSVITEMIQIKDALNLHPPGTGLQWSFQGPFHSLSIYSLILWPKFQKKQQNPKVTTDNQSANPSWCQVPIWDPWPVFLQSLSHIATDGQSVSQSVCLSWCQAQILDIWPEIFFFFIVTVLSFWSALSDERLGLSCVSLCHWSLPVYLQQYLN
jgi:hypothetical protein